MAWEVNDATKVVAMVNGDEKTFSYESNTSLKEVVTDVARKLNLSSVNVQCDGNEVQQSEGNTQIGNYKEVVITPKIAGAI